MFQAQSTLTEAYSTRVYYPGPIVSSLKDSNICNPSIDRKSKNQSPDQTNRPGHPCAIQPGSGA